MPSAEAHRQYLLARAWHGKGTVARAITGYREVLALDPGHTDAALRLGHLLQDNARFEEALAVFRAALEHEPHESRLHKRFVDVLLLLEGIDAVFRHYKLERVDSRIPSLAPGEPLVCTVLRNERARLPYFLDYYRKLGIRWFFAVDNASSDGSGEYLEAQADVCLWQSPLPFRESNFGAAWFEPILRQHASGHWCLIVDADELFYYSDCERRGIGVLCDSLDRTGALGMRAMLLDMYADRSVQETVYEPGQPFETTCPYFDREYVHSRVENAGPFSNMPFLYGGVRQRVFGEAGGYLLSKVPLVKYRPSTILAGGQHWTNAPAERLAGETGCLLHFKFFSTFTNYATAVANQEHDFHWVQQHREYVREMGPAGDVTLYDERHSIRFENSEQLVTLGVMQRDANLVPVETPVFPHIEPIGDASPRPMWSVMLTVYRRRDTIGRALQSVLDQAQAPEQMQIEVISDGPPDAAHAEIEALVRSVGSNRVAFYAHPERAGHPEIFNVCLRRARGEWIHILHDDDWIAPGFYEAFEDGSRRAPSVGAMFCRHQHTDGEGRVTRLSALERESAGVVEGWVERIATLSRVQAVSMVVRRTVYEQLGGYCAQARSAFDWEMWQRIAVHFPVWFEPRPLAYFSESDATESARLTAAGAQIADTRAAIEVAQTYLPPEQRQILQQRAREMYGLVAIDAAQALWLAGNAEGALANLREAVMCSESNEVSNKMRTLLQTMQGSEE